NVRSAEENRPEGWPTVIPPGGSGVAPVNLCLRRLTTDPDLDWNPRAAIRWRWNPPSHTPLARRHFGVDKPGDSCLCRWWPSLREGTRFGSERARVRIPPTGPGPSAGGAYCGHERSSTPQAPGGRPTAHARPDAHGAPLDPAPPPGPARRVLVRVD